MRERVGDFWLRLGSLSTFGVAKSAVAASRLAVRFAFIRKSLPLSLAALLALNAVFCISFVLMFEYLEIASVDLYQLESEILATIAFYSISVPVCLLSVIVTLNLFARAERAETATSFISYVVFEIVLSGLIAVSVYYANWETFGFLNRVFGLDWVFHVPNINNLLVLSIFPALVVSLLPTALNIIILLCALLAKILGFILAPVVMLILLRFHESRSGVLTNLAIFLGMALKLSQQAIKIYL